MASERSKREEAEQRHTSVARREAKRPSKVSVTKHRDISAAARADVQHRARSARQFARAPRQVRIIGGVWKRTPLPVPDVAGLRPTPDRVRETLFNWIEHLAPALGAVRGLDLFAGTGALGFELASRGALRVTLVENNRQLAGQLAQTKRKLTADQVDIVAADALALAARLPAASFEVIFLDPPFDSSLLAPALVAAGRLIKPEGLVYVESGAPIKDSMLVQSGLQIARSGRAARVHFYLLRP